MKARMQSSGRNFREETLKDAIDYESWENANDLSYCDSFYRVLNHDDYHSEDNYEKINPRLYSRKWASYKNHEMNIKTLISEPIHYGELFYNQEDNTFWLCIEVDCEDGVCYKGVLIECNYLLFWQRADGKIIHRYCTIINASSYSNGEKGNKTIVLQTNQFMAYMPYDSETNQLDVNKRINVSKTKCRPYVVTRVDDIAYNYGNTGILNMILTQDSFNEKTDFEIEYDSYGRKTWICDYFETTSNTTPTPPQPNINAILQFSGKNSLKVGGSYKTIKAVFQDGNGIELNETANWDIVSTDNIIDNLSKKIDGNILKIKINDTDVVDGGIIRVIISDSNNTTSTFEDFNVLMS